MDDEGIGTDLRQLIQCEQIVRPIHCTYNIIPFVTVELNLHFIKYVSNNAHIIRRTYLLYVIKTGIWIQFKGTGTRE